MIKLVQTKGKRKLIGYNSDLLASPNSIEPLLEPFHKKALILGPEERRKPSITGFNSWDWKRCLFHEAATMPIQ